MNTKAIHNNRVKTEAEGREKEQDLVLILRNTKAEVRENDLN